MNYRLVILYLILGTSTLPLWSQNLVLNPGFEDYQNDGRKLGLLNPIQYATHWSSPNKGKPKLYTSTEAGNVYDEYGASWNFKAREGKNVAGIYVYGGTDMDYSAKRDYIQGSLSKPLEVGKKYYFSFWVHYHCEGSNKIGIAFLPENTRKESPGLLRMQAVSYQEKVARHKQTEWTAVQDSFIAYKPFKHFIIGNFFRNEETQIESNNYGHHFAYIDDVKVEEAPNQANVTVEVDKEELMKWEMNVIRSQQSPLTRSTETPVVEDLSSPQLKAFFARQIFFDLDSDKIRAEEQEYLEVLVGQMKENKDFKIIIKGFASDEGTDPSNLSLSSARAESVRNFFRSKGINPARLYIRALGEIEGPGDASRGKEFNRRVEFEIVNR